MRLVLTGIAACSFFHTSYAVNLNNDGTGQVLIYPYYTVQNGNQTLISVLNFSTLGKAVKLRIREGRNSRTVLSLNLYLGPEDVWTGAIFDTDNTGAGALISTDRSCTVPELSQSPERLNGLPFVSFSSAGYTNPSDGGPATLERTREGFVEVLEMGTILANSELAGLISQQNGQTSTCSQVAQRWASQTGNNTPFRSSIAAASSGLIGTGTIVDVANGTYIDYRAQTLDGFYLASMHSRPEALVPSLASADPQSTVLHEGRAIHSQWPNRGEDAVSSVLMAEQLRNEFTTELALNGKTEWVITFPTKAFYVDPYLTGNTTPLMPFRVSADKGASCELPLFYFRDRESQRNSDPVALGGLLPPPTTLCFSVNVLSFLQTITMSADLVSSPSAIFGSRLTRNVTPIMGTAAIRTGWLSIDFSQSSTFGAPGMRRLRSSLEGHQFVGLPTVGFAAVRLENISASPGLRASYGGAYLHKRKTDCVKTVDDGAIVDCQ